MRDWDIQHPEITWAESTGYPSWNQDNNDGVRCDQCGEKIEDYDEVYSDSRNDFLCLYCLRLLHRRFV